MLRWSVQQLPNWDWDKLQTEVSKGLPMRWWAIQHIAANPRDLDLSFQPFTNEKLQYVRTRLVSLFFCHMPSLLSLGGHLDVS